MSDLERITKKSLGQLLVDEGIVTPDQLEDALREQKRTSELLGEVLLKKGYTTESEIAKALCEQFGKPFCKASLYDIAPEVLELLPPRLCVDRGFVPLDKFGDILVIAMGGLVDLATFQQIRSLTHCDVEVFISTASDVRGVLRARFPDLFDPITLQPIFRPEEPQAELRREVTELEEGFEDVDDMGGTTREVVGVADEDSDWEALFEEMERNVLNELENKRAS